MVSIWRYSFVIINVLRCSVDYVYTCLKILFWNKFMPFYVLEKCVSEHVWRFFCEENVTHELIHFEEWKMCVNMFEDFLFPNIVLCEVMYFRGRKICYQCEELILKINVMFVLKHFGEPKVWVNKSEVFILKKKITVIHFLEKRCAGKCLEIIWKIVMVLSDCLSIIYCIWLNYSTLEHYWKYWLNFLTVTQLLIVIDWTIWFQKTYWKYWWNFLSVSQ